MAIQIIQRLVESCDHEFVSYFLNNQFYVELCQENLDKGVDGDCVLQALGVVHALLNYFLQFPSQIKYNNFLLKLENSGLIAKIEQLQDHKRDDIYQKVSNISERIEISSQVYSRSALEQEEVPVQEERKDDDFDRFDLDPRTLARLSQQ